MASSKKDEARWVKPPPMPSRSVSEHSDDSIDPPPTFDQSKTQQSKPSGSVSQCSEWSMDGQPTFKEGTVKGLQSVYHNKELSGVSAHSKYQKNEGKRSNTPQSMPSGSVSQCSEWSMDGQPTFKEGTVKDLQSVFNKKELSGVSADSKYKKGEGKRSNAPQSMPSGSVSQCSEWSMDGQPTFKEGTVKGLQSVYHNKELSGVSAHSKYQKDEGKRSNTPQSMPSGSVSQCSEWSMDGQPTFKEGTVKDLQSVFNKKELSGVSADSKYKMGEGKRGTVKGLQSVYHNKELSGVSADSKYQKDEGKRSGTAPSKPNATVRKSYDQSIEGNPASKQSKTPQSMPSGAVSQCSEWSMDGQPTFKEGTVKGLQSVFHEKELSGVSADSKCKKDEGKRSGQKYQLPKHVEALQTHTLINLCEKLDGNSYLHSKTSDVLYRSAQMQICYNAMISGGKERRDSRLSETAVPSPPHPTAKEHLNATAGSLKWSQGEEMQAIQTEEYSDSDSETEYITNDRSSEPETVVPPPGKITFSDVKPNSLVLSWGVPKGLKGPKNFKVKCNKGEWIHGRELKGYYGIKGAHKVEINDLELGQRYIFSVATEDEDGNLSEWVEDFVFTAVPAPRLLTKKHSEANAVTLKWTKGEYMEGIKHQFLITLRSQGIESLVIQTKECFKTISNLEPETLYTIDVATILMDRCSEPVCTTILTGSCFRKVLSNMGFEEHYEKKLTLSAVLEINQHDASENKRESSKSYLEAFLQKLMMFNANARSVKCVSKDVDTDKRNDINPLDLITALFLCSDGFLQQDMVVKMALCQFAVPLLMPNHDTRKITMMLWSMREIVRTFSPSKRALRNLSCEERIVLTDIPLVSFVRLGRTILSKSQVLNKLLSNTKECYDVFYNRNMECGDVPRKISEGLVEVTWYLPCGKKNTDKFTEPLAVANLRGDIRDFDKQFSFLCQTSAAVYIFCDESETDYFKDMEGMDVEARLLLISSIEGKNFTLNTMTIKPSLKTTAVSQRKNTESELVKALQESISKLLGNCPIKVSLANLADTARHFDILVDEDMDECQDAGKNEDNIFQHISNTSSFKEKQLPSQGPIWKRISMLETEYWRLRNAGHQNTEDYRKSLKTQEKDLKMKQQRLEISAAMHSFLHGVTSEVQRNYFLKWLEMDLDNLSRNQLSDLKDRYEELREKCPKDTEKIAEMDQQISACSLRLEHFFRECGQLFECANHLPEFSSQRTTLEQLPAICAQMLLDGFPLELVDGDSANIPMKWITEVLRELHKSMHSNSKLKVITIIGAENSGKSTLLNTMFGVKFAVSKGTCTRGAFIHLINVNKHLRKKLECDCIMIIDTEGLKPHQMVQDDHSHERDREVASLTVALSDVTIVSVSGDSSKEKDLLEMVLHAFTKLKNVGKKPLCHFVHTNMSESPAVERKKRGKELVKQLNEVIRKDTRMRKAKITKCSDVMEFDPETFSWYIPPVWNGTPPMAPFSVDYSETAHTLKKRLIEDLKKCQGRGDLMQFISNIDRFWKGL
ncbi:up-regulator of cell proliferation-like isoform X4 [Eleginops maclovinus]|uniref:up-regulator of cell proliferation-like isoform X4 n=1 Tax=Eleginops maclovinus TaxID=56733 RepID=UPI0030800C2E